MLDAGRRQFITLLGGAAAAWPLAARAQQPGKLPLVGVLVSASPPHPFADALRRGLQNLGYSERRNITLEVRYSGGRSDRAGEIATEFVRLGVDVIVAHFTPAVRARAVGRTKLATDGARRKAGRSKKSDGRQLRSQTNGQPVGLWADGLFQQKRVVIRIRPEDSR